MKGNEAEILLIEDNLSDMELALIAFERRSLQNIVHVVSDGDQPLRNAIKVIFLDLKLPKVDGMEILKEIKSNPLTKMIPVVVLTSSSEEKDIYQSYQLGVNSFITKPIDFDQFILTVGRIGYYWLMINQIPSKN
jgi:two-component system response regulator